MWHQRGVSISFPLTLASLFSVPSFLWKKAVIPSPLPDLRLYPDMEHAPFLHGVASADPLSDSVLIWTRVSLDYNSSFLENKYETTKDQVVVVEWKLWKSSMDLSSMSFSSFDYPLKRGTASTSSDVDWTVTVEVNGLEAGTSYHYMFVTKDGQQSTMGTTRTAPTSSSDDGLVVKVATLSCTSLWSGYFNFYRHLSERTDIDVVLHVGDFIYPDIDPDEVYRVPYGLCAGTRGGDGNDDNNGDNTVLDLDWFKNSNVGGLPEDNADPYLTSFVASLDCTSPSSTSPSSTSWINTTTHIQHPDNESVDVVLSRYRWIYQLYALDPDFRAARANHPFVVTMDNHDLQRDSGNDPTEGSRKAALEWQPQRVTYYGDNDNENNNDSTMASYENVHTLRRFRYGSDLLDMVVMDTYSHEINKTANGLLGESQHQWLTQVLTESASAHVRWRILGSCKTFMPFLLNRILLVDRFKSLLQSWFNYLLTIHGGGYNGEGNKVEPVYLNASPETWEGQPDSMERLFDQLEATGTASNNLWVVGDMHYCYHTDVFRFDHKDVSTVFDVHDEGKTRYGGEFLSCSGSRGNLDEIIGSIFRGLALPCVEWIMRPSPTNPIYNLLLKPFTNKIISWMNPHFRYFNGYDHGYGVASFQHDRVDATIHFFPILEISTDTVINTHTMTMIDGSNRWSL